MTALTGMNVYAAVFSIRLGVCVLGGLRATLLCESPTSVQTLKTIDLLTFLTGDYNHTFIVMIIILYFMFCVYTSNALIGSPNAMSELLKEASMKRPVECNQDGSYLN